MKSIGLSLSRGFLLTLLLVVPLSGRGEDWPHFRGPDYNGISRETGWATTWPQEGPKRLWEANVGIGFSSLAVASGRLYTAGNAEDRDSVYCFDAETGQELWRHTYEEPLAPKYYEGGSSATPTVDGDRVYTLSKQGKLFCLRTADGKVVWQQDLPAELGLTDKKKHRPTWGFAGSVVVLGERLLLNVGATGTALDKKTGQGLWSSGKDAGGYSTPVPFTVGGEPHVAFFTREDVVAVTVSQGKELWRYPWKTKYDVNAADPLVFGDKVFISAGYGHGCALLKFSGSNIAKEWENKNLRNMLNSSVLLGEHIYGIDGDGGNRNASLRCLDVATGTVQWEEPSVRAGSLMAADGRLIVLSEKGELMVAEASPQAFQPSARVQVLGGKCWTVPVLANGRIYCRNAQGDLVCLDVRGK